MVLAVPPPPMAWYGSSFAYYDDPEPTEAELDAAAEQARAQRVAGFTPEQFGPRPGGGGDTTGVVLGRFLPVHDGHRYLIEFARGHVTELHVLVRVEDGDPIPGEVRRRWLAELFPGVTVTSFTGEPAVHADFLFTAEGYGPELAQRIGATLVPVDRAEVPVSGSQVRADPWAFERYLPPPVKAWYTRRVCLVGAECSGKTSLAARLAGHYGTVWAREQLRKAGRELRPADLARAAHAQRVAEDLLARRASRVLFADTAPFSVRLWSERLFGTAPAWMADDSPAADLYLLLAPDLPFTGPERHNAPAERRAFHEACRADLDRQGRRYVAIDGPHEHRFAAAVEAVDALLAR